MAQPLPFVLDVPETPGDQGSQEPSPYDESEVHDSFQQLIQEQSWRAAQEGLELQQRVRGAAGSGQHTLSGSEGTHSAATLRILASMPSRTIGEWDPQPRPESALAPGLGQAGVGFPPGICVAQSQAQCGFLAHPVCCLDSPMRPSLGSKNDSRSCPAASAGRSRGAIISQYYNRTVQLRHRSSRSLLGNLVRSARPSLRMYDLELDPRAQEEEGE
ncbi:hypothetical protein P7K49_011910 [Saguinus oedipus]|uniref:Transmembrane channel-like protein 6 n=1 Tax=Saguinus oedipus TaxID=9490 RepID=A0ABQ9VUE5_SAGOE|nr:hypothetical protein P7K49_011910 [Saguinus oedipus]